MAEKGNDGFLEFQRDMWRSRIDAPAQVFEALLAAHTRKISGMDAGDAASRYEAMLINAQSERQAGPAKQTRDAIRKLSRGFALAADTIATFFRDGVALSGDIRDVILHPQEPPSTYPSPVPEAQGHFIKALSEFLPDEFWLQDKILQKLKKRGDMAADFLFAPYNDGTTDLFHLFQAQEMRLDMLFLADALKENGNANLATIARCFALKGSAISDDIIARTELVITSSVDRALSAPKAPEL